MQKNPYKAYSQASHTVAKTRQVVMLYDGVIRNLQQASEAMKHNHIEERYKKLVRASEIVIGLQGCLDFENAEPAARVLYDFYSSIDARLLSLHRSNDINLCNEIINELKEVREMWDKIDRGDGQAETPHNGAATKLTQDQAPVPYPQTNPEHRSYSSNASSSASGIIPSKTYDV